MSLQSIIQTLLGGWKPRIRCFPRSSSSQVFFRCSQVFLKIRKIYRKTLVLVACYFLEKETSTQMFYREFWEIFQTTFFIGFYFQVVIILFKRYVTLTVVIFCTVRFSIRFFRLVITSITTVQNFNCSFAITLLYTSVMSYVKLRWRKLAKVSRSVNARINSREN